MIAKILWREYPQLEDESLKGKWPCFPEEVEAILAFRFPGEFDPKVNATSKINFIVIIVLPFYSATLRGHLRNPSLHH